MHKPALILTFNRVEAALKLCQKLIDLKVREIYISVDGANDQITRPRQIWLIGELKNLSAHHEVKILVRHAQQNLGVSAGVISGIDWFFACVNSGYILEDDLIFNEDFLNFCDRALEEFRNDEDVWMISGNNYREFGSLHVWTNYPLIWGWATWSKKWNVFRNQLEMSQLNFSRRRIRRSTQEFWKAGYRRAFGGHLDSWAVPFAAQMRAQERLCLLPPTNLVSNFGVDNFASHTIKPAWHSNWEIGNLNQFIDYEESWMSTDVSTSVITQNRLLEKKVYNIRLRHIFVSYYSLVLDYFRKSPARPLLVRLHEASKHSYKYFSYDLHETDPTSNNDSSPH